MRIRKNLNIEKEAETIFLAEIASALSHPVRIAILHYVNSNKKLCNKDLVENFTYSQPSISQHIKKLKDVGLLNVTYSNRFSIYKINKELLKQYRSNLRNI